MTSEATARANADGTLSARASLSLDVNGNIAGYKIGSDVNLAGVTTSEFSVTADTFKIFNGTHKISPFSVSSGTVYMTNVRVSSSLDIGSGNNQVRIVGDGIQVGSGFGEISMGGASSQMFLNIGTLYHVQIGGGVAGGYVRLGGPGYDNVVLGDGGNGSFAGSLTINGNTYSGSFSSNGNASFDSLNVGNYASINGAGFTNSTFNLHPGSNNSMSTGEDGGAYGAQTGAYLAMRVNGRTVWVPFFTALP